jgi:integrase
MRWNRHRDIDMKNTVDVLRSVKPHTRRVYEQAWRDLSKFSGDAHCLMSLTTADVQAWVDDMTVRGLAASTIRTRLSAVSALFEAHNDPTLGIKRPSAEATRETMSLDGATDVTKLLRAIDLESPHGAQDFALIGTLLLTGWGVERVRTLVWADFVMRGGQVLLRDGQGNIPLPRNLWELIVRCVRHLHGTISLPTGAYLFVAIDGFGGAPVSVQPSARQPLSPQEINRRVARYARLAGLESSRLSSRGLAVTRKNLGDQAIYAIVEKVKPVSPSLIIPGRNLRVWRRAMAS